MHQTVSATKRVSSRSPLGSLPSGGLASPAGVPAAPRSCLQAVESRAAQAQLELKVVEVRGEVHEHGDERLASPRRAVQVC